MRPQPKVIAIRLKGKPYKRNDVKKAIVTLAEGEMIDITSGI